MTEAGTGGLVRAYGHSAKEGLYAVGIANLQLSVIYTIRADYADLGKIQYELLQAEHIILDTVYNELVELKIVVEKSKEDAFEKQFINLFNGNQIFEKEQEIYGYWKNEKFSLLDNE